MVYNHSYKYLYVALVPYSRILRNNKDLSDDDVIVIPGREPKTFCLKPISHLETEAHTKWTRKENIRPVGEPHTTLMYSKQHVCVCHCGSSM